jgi:hypothetical protein
MVNLREIYKKGEEELEAEKLKRKREKYTRDHAEGQIARLASLDIYDKLVSLDVS